MPSSSVTRRYNNARLVPLYPGAYNRRRPVNLQPSTTFAAGTVLGISGVAANAVQTQTTTGTPTGGTITNTFVDPISGDTIPFTFAFDAAASAVQTALRAAIGNSDVAVTGGPSPGTALVYTFSGRYASLPVYPMTADVTAATGGTNTASTFAQTTVGRTANTYGKYTGGGATDPAKCLLEYACVTDAAGYASFGSQAYSGEGEISPSVPAWFGGVFKTTDLTGLDAGAIVDMGGRLESGTAADGVLLIP